MNTFAFFHSTPLLTQSKWGAGVTKSPEFLQSIEDYEGFHCPKCSESKDPKHNTPYTDIVNQVREISRKVGHSVNGTILSVLLIRKCSNCGHQENIHEQANFSSKRWDKYFEFLLSFCRVRDCKIEDLCIDTEPELQEWTASWVDDSMCFCPGCCGGTVDPIFQPLKPVRFIQCDPCGCPRETPEQWKNLDLGFKWCNQCFNYECMNCKGCFTVSFPTGEEEDPPTLVDIPCPFGTPTFDLTHFE